MITLCGPTCHNTQFDASTYISSIGEYPPLLSLLFDKSFFVCPFGGDSMKRDPEVGFLRKSVSTICQRLIWAHDSFPEKTHFMPPVTLCSHITQLTTRIYSLHTSQHRAITDTRSFHLCKCRQAAGPAEPEVDQDNFGRQVWHEKKSYIRVKWWHIIYIYI